jgi:Lrp/AsnC family transcriptional regulator, leucine-responsive regulatory protein
MDFDDIDRHILQLLQRDGRLHNVELAKQVGLSPSPCLRRVKRLEEAGVITRYAALLDPAKIDLGLTVFARVWLTGQDEDTVNPFIEAIRKVPEVVECHLMAGDCDFLLRVLARDLEDYRRFQIEHLGRIKGVRNIKTDIPMQKVKQSTELPVRGQAAPRHPPRR